MIICQKSSSGNLIKSNLNNSESSISIFPNPATKEISIKYITTINSPINYSIYDVIGNEYLNGTTNDKINSTTDKPKAAVLLAFPFVKNTNKLAIRGTMINNPTNISFYLLIFNTT